MKWTRELLISKTQGRTQIWEKGKEKSREGGGRKITPKTLCYDRHVSQAGVGRGKKK